MRGVVRDLTHRNSLASDKKPLAPSITLDSDPHDRCEQTNGGRQIVHTLLGPGVRPTRTNLRLYDLFIGGVGMRCHNKHGAGRVKCRRALDENIEAEGSHL